MSSRQADNGGQKHRQRLMLQIRGGSGAGKTTLVRNLLRECDAEVVERQRFRLKGGTQVTVPLWRADGDLYVLGGYNLDGVSPGSGGDKVNGSIEQAVLDHYSHLPRFIWESLRGSLKVPKQPEVDEWIARGWVVAHLNTPLEERIRRIERRRLERNTNVGTPINLKRMQEQDRSVPRQVNRARDLGVPTIELDYREPLEGLIAFLEANGAI